jgi:hypothetical protein
MPLLDAGQRITSRVPIAEAAATITNLLFVRVLSLAASELEFATRTLQA